MTNSTPLKKFSTIVLAIILLMMFINVLSAYIRHVESGLGCAPWPSCYADLAYMDESKGMSDAASERFDAVAPLKNIHRTVATVLVVLVLLVVHQSRQQSTIKYNRLLPYLMLATLLVLAVIGPASYLKTRPLIALMNLTAGLALLSFSWLLWLQLTAPELLKADLEQRKRVTIGLVLLGFQILLGGWVSANFAGDACNQLANCLPSMSEDLNWQGLWLLRDLSLNDSGRVTDSASGLIQAGHRLFAIVVAAYLLWLGLWSAGKTPLIKRCGILVLVLLGVQIILGLSVVSFELPLWVVIGHNIVATLLFMALVKLKYLVG
jgi:cytochrome c oxidase assembly protein subunit 15